MYTVRQLSDRYRSLSNIDEMNSLEKIDWSPENAHFNFITLFGAYMAEGEINAGVVCIFFGMMYRIGNIFESNGLGRDVAYEWGESYMPRIRRWMKRNELPQPCECLSAYHLSNKIMYTKSIIALVTIVVYIGGLYGLMQLFWNG